MNNSTSRFTPIKCLCCGELFVESINCLKAHISFLVKNKLPFYAWNEWMTNSKSNMSNENLAEILNEIAAFLPGFYNLLRSNHFQWACDNCIESDRAIDAEILKQKFSTHPPYLAYYDKEQFCENCERKFIFTKNEQKYWYEDLSFWVQSYPKNCEYCRKRKRDENRINQQLATMLKTLNIEDQVQLITISGLYLELGSIAKAKHYNTLANKTNLK